MTSPNKRDKRVEVKTIPEYSLGADMLHAEELTATHNQGLGSAGRIHLVVNHEDQALIPHSGLYVKEEPGMPGDQSVAFRVWGPEGSDFEPLTIVSQFAPNPDNLAGRVAVFATTQANVRN